MNYRVCPQSACDELSAADAEWCETCGTRLVLGHLDHGYVRDRFPSQGKPLAREHRVVAERMLGRPLRADEVVHHINGVRTDNRPENLQVMSPSEHSLLHWRLRKERAA